MGRAEQNQWIVYIPLQIRVSLSDLLFSACLAVHIAASPTTQDPDGWCRDSHLG